MWHFVLESVDGDMKLEATDEEPEVDPERLELLAVVRGLEALEPAVAGHTCNTKS